MFSDQAALPATRKYEKPPLCGFLERLNFSGAQPYLHVIVHVFLSAG